VDHQESNYHNTPLLLACLRSNAEAVRLLLRYGANANSQNKHGDACLHKVQFYNLTIITIYRLPGGGRAISIGRVPTRTAWLPRHSVARSKPSRETALARAINRRNSKAARTLFLELSAFSKCHAKDGQGHEDGHAAQTVLEEGLILACREGLVDHVNLCFDELQISPNIRDSHGVTPLHAAVSRSFGIHVPKLELVRSLLGTLLPLSIRCINSCIARNVDVNAADQEGNTPFHTAVAAHVEPEVLELLVGGGADTTIANASSLTPFHTAILSQSLSAIEFLTRECSEPLPPCANLQWDRKDERGNSILHRLAASEEFGHCLRPLIAAVALTPEQLNCQNTAGETPLHRSVTNSALEAFRILLNAGADPLVVNSAGQTVLDLVIEETAVEFLHLLTESARALEWMNETVTGNLKASRDNEGRSLLHRAAAQGDIKCVEMCLRLGLDVNTPTDGPLGPFKTGGTPLHLAAEAGDETMLKHLLNCGAEINSVAEFNGDSPAHLAARNGHSSCLRVLLDCGAVPKVLNKEGESVLDVARLSDCEQCLEMVEGFLSRSAEGLQ
jgi:ankyrin repeat protein